MTEGPWKVYAMEDVIQQECLIESQLETYRSQVSWQSPDWLTNEETRRLCCALLLCCSLALVSA